MVVVSHVSPAQLSLNYLYGGCYRTSRPHTQLSRIRKRQRPGERLRQGSMRSASGIMISRRGRSWSRARAARSRCLWNCFAPCCRAALRQGDMQHHGHRLHCYQSVPAVWPVRAIVRNRQVPGHIRLCVYIVQTLESIKPMHTFLMCHASSKPIQIK